MMAQMAAPLRHLPRAWRPPPLLRRTGPFSVSSLTPSASVVSLLLGFAGGTRRYLSGIAPSAPRSFHSTSPALDGNAGFQAAQGLRLAGMPLVESDSEEDASDSDGTGKKSKNQKKREGRRAVQWGMDLAEFPLPQIKRILRAVSIDEEEVYEALVLVKRLGPDVREGKRRQFSYIGRLLRNAQPELMDSLIQASKDHDNGKFQALVGQGILTDEDDDEEEKLDSEEECQESIDTACRWFDGLINKDSFITKEVYSLHNVDFDRQELRKLVRRVQAVEETEITEGNGAESPAVTRARNSLLRFLRGLATQAVLAA